MVMKALRELSYSAWTRSKLTAITPEKVVGTVAAV